MAVLPKKRTTRKSCAEAANIFAVRVRDSRFGQTDRLPAIVKPVIVGPTVLSSERAKVDLESVNVYNSAARPVRSFPDELSCCPGRFPSMISVQP